MNAPFRKMIDLLVVVLALVCCECYAQKPENSDAKHADKDYLVQGEYLGDIELDSGTRTVGIQVIALGQGTFRAVAFPGGLPGAGWNGEHRSEFESDMQDSVVTFTGKRGTVRIIDKAIEIDLDGDGEVDGRLQRVDRQSPTLGQAAPEGAAVLFDGTNVEQWKTGWMADDGLLMQGATSKQQFGSHKIHIEFRLPFEPENLGQKRGNSGIYLQGRYEVQMLDSFGLEGKDNECGGLYKIKDPDVNMCLPPLSWQTYDIDYTATRYDADGKVASAPRITVRHNGVLVHDDVQLPSDRSTTGAPLKPGPEPGPVYLQDHRNPVRYRNIWVLETE